MSIVKVDIDGEKYIKIHAAKELVLLRDILPKTMSDIRGRMRIQKAIKSRAITDRGARGQGRSGKVRSPGRSPVPAALEGKADPVKSGVQGDRRYSRRFAKRRFS